jgi:tRNA-dihydrouridine synthase
VILAVGRTRVASAADAHRALTQTSCAGVMVGRRAIQHPWIFREARALLDEGRDHPPPTAAERLELCRLHLQENVEARGEPFGVQISRRHFAGYLAGLPQAPELRQALNRCDSLSGCLDILASATATATATATANTKADRHQAA